MTFFYLFILSSVILGYQLYNISIPLCGNHYCGHPGNNPSSDPRIYCKCDCACVTFGDCCADFDVNLHCAAENPADLSIDGINIAYYDCIGLPGFIEDNHGLVLVTKCPKSWTEVNTKLNCEVERNITDIIGILPVYNSLNITFKNIYCATCHGVDPLNVTFWDVEARFTSEDANT